MPSKNYEMPEFKMPEFKMPEFEEEKEVEVEVAVADSYDSYGGSKPCHQHDPHHKNKCKDALVDILKELDDTQEKFNDLLQILICKLKEDHGYNFLWTLKGFTGLFEAMADLQKQIAETIEEACDCDLCDKDRHKDCDKDCHKDRY